MRWSWRFIRRRRKLIILLCMCIYLCLLVNLPKIVFPQWDGKGNAEVVILMWEKCWNLEEDALLKLINYARTDSDKMCFDGVKITYDREQLERATAIVMWNFYYYLNFSDLPKTRRADQLWVLFSHESPAYHAKLKAFNNLFNWTMTYRKDSDVYAPYGEYLALDEEEQDIHVNGVPLDDFISRKSGLLTGVISNCKTPGRREEFIDKLGTEGNMTVDVFGRCGTHICHRLSNYARQFKLHVNKTIVCDHGKWWRELGAKYKFYFAGENSICTDYITEKFWRSLEIGMVPLAYGGGSYSLFAPPHSFIDVRDFKSAKDVADFLRRLDKDETEYKKYFEWRRKYQVVMGEGALDTWAGFGLQGWCKLSRRVKEFRERVDSDPRALQELSKTIHDLDSWWTHEAGSQRTACGPPPI